MNSPETATDEGSLRALVNRAAAVQKVIQSTAGANWGESVNALLQLRLLDELGKATLQPVLLKELATALAKLNEQSGPERSRDLSEEDREAGLMGQVRHLFYGNEESRV
jgi:hypothetical protein